MTRPLDTHALPGGLSDAPVPGPEATTRIGDPANDIVAGIVSPLEITVKSRVGKPGADIAEDAVFLSKDRNSMIARGPHPFMVGESPRAPPRMPIENHLK